MEKAALLMMTLAACSTPKTDADNELRMLASDRLPLTTLTITKVKKPWYAWRGLVVSKMKDSFPEYLAIPGLLHKYYCFSENRNFFGGIYFWETPQQANAWFSPDWFFRTKKKYGVEGVVLRFQIDSIRTSPALPGNKAEWIAVLSYPKGTSPDWPEVDGDLVQIVTLKDFNGQVCWLTVWASKAAAVSNLSSTQFENEFFEVPLLLRPTR